MRSREMTGGVVDGHEELFTQTDGLEALNPSQPHSVFLIQSAKTLSTFDKPHKENFMSLLSTLLNLRSGEVAISFQPPNLPDARLRTAPLMPKVPSLLARMPELKAHLAA